MASTDSTATSGKVFAPPTWRPNESRSKTENVASFRAYVSEMTEKMNSHQQFLEQGISKVGKKENEKESNDIERHPNDGGEAQGHEEDAQEKKGTEEDGRVKKSESEEEAEDTEEEEKTEESETDTNSESDVNSESETQSEEKAAIESDDPLELESN
ncbi:neurofilament light polypeptide-like [Chenopodium quinoa]|uniref:neurofilament light polypeptide-like n=1 Tax=Chenopodium quinoa TaxID=63459 RepID=UPI000B77AEF6|nr:neurofilament light polypeptide-like [Chenopodium quinoa]